MMPLIPGRSRVGYKLKKQSSIICFLDFLPKEYRFDKSTNCYWKAVLLAVWIRQCCQQIHLIVSDSIYKWRLQTTNYID